MSYDAMLWFPFVKKWGELPQYREASLAARAIVDGAMLVFMGRGSLPASPDALRRAIGADEKEFSRGYVEARVCIEILTPQWETELTDAFARWEMLRERNRKNGRNGGRKPRTQTEPSGEPNGKPSGEPNGEPLANPVVTHTLSTSTSTDLTKVKSPKAPRSARSGGDAPEGFDAFWEGFKARYPKRPGQPWSEGKKAMLSALKRHPELNLKTVLEGASAYCELMVATHKVGTDKVAHASTWINQDRWESDYTMMPIDSSGWDDESVF